MEDSAIGVDGENAPLTVEVVDSGDFVLAITQPQKEKENHVPSIRETNIGAVIQARAEVSPFYVLIIYENNTKNVSQISFKST